MSMSQNGKVLWSPLWDKQVLYWHKNQIVVTLHSQQEHPDLTNEAQVQQSIDALNLKELELFLQRRGCKIRPFQQTDIPQPTTQQTSSQTPIDTSITSRTGKHLFRSPTGKGSVAVCFFHVETDTASASYAHKAVARGTVEADMAPTIISLINNNLDKLRQGGRMPIVAAMPNWLGGATPDGTGDGGSFGCPTCPPLPVPSQEVCNPGHWLFNLPELSHEMQKRKGEGVTVFVLDTIPTAAQIKAAAARVGSSNRQLQDFAAKI